MKKTFVLILALVFVMLATSAFATIANTKHNLTTGGSGTITTDATATLCGFCHIPHGGNTTVAGLPLWARGVSAGPFQLYGGGFTLTGTVVGNPGTFSLTCLSCHDGTIGLGTITKNGVSTTFPMTTTLTGGLAAGGRFQATNIEANGYSPYIGTDLRNDHPVGFTFPATGYGLNAAVPGISLVVDDPGSPGLSRLTGTSGASYPLYVVAGLDQFECATCHDPHLENTGTTQTKFLRSPNKDFCQDCHDTK
jgi:predicted CXXCH cytochrome family protein